MPSEIFRQSILTPGTSFLHAKDYAEEAFSAGASMYRGIDLSAGFDLKSALAAGVGPEASAAVNAQAEARGGISLRAQFPMNIVSKSGAGVVSRFQAAIEASASAGLTVSLTGEQLLELLTPQFAGPARRLLDLFAQEISISAGLWAKAAFAIEILGEGLATITIWDADEGTIDPGLTVSYHYAAGWIYGSGVHFQANYSIPNPRILVSRLSRLAADAVTQEIDGFAVREGMATVSPEMRVAASIAGLLIPAVTTTLYDVALAIAADQKTVDGPLALLSAIFDAMKSKLLQAIIDYATSSLGEALGYGLAKALPGLAAADIQQLRAAVADLSAAVAAFEATPPEDPATFLTTVLNIVGALDKVLMVALPDQVKKDVTSTGAVLFAAANLIHRVLTWRGTDPAGRSPQFAGVAAQQVPGSTIVGSITRAGADLQLTDLIQSLMTPGLIDSILYAVPEAAPWAGWVASTTGQDLGTLAHYLLADLADTRALYPMIKDALAAVIPRLASDFLDPIANAATTPAELKTFITSVVEPLAMLIPNVVLPAVAALQGDPAAADRAADAFGAALLGTIAQFIDGATSALVGVVRTGIDASITSLITDLRTNGLAGPMAADLRKIAPLFGLNASTIADLLGIARRSSDDIVAAFGTTSALTLSGFNLHLGEPQGSSSVTGLLTTDKPIAASRLPELVGKVAETSTVVAGDLLLDSFAIAGTIALGEIETAYQAIEAIVTPIVQSISDFVKHLETQIEAATQAAEKLAGQFEAALAAIFADIDRCLDQLKTLTDTFVHAVRAWGIQQIEANVWPPLQPVAIGLWDAALGIATWIPQLFVDIVDIAGHVLHDMLASAAKGAATAGDQVHAAARQLVHSFVHTDYSVPLDLAGNSRTIGVDRRDFARIGCDVILNDPGFTATVAANLGRAADAARLNANVKAANANVAAINTYADAAINESFGLVSGDGPPNVSVSPPEGSVWEGALVLEIIVNGANPTYLGDGVLQMPPRLLVQIDGMPVEGVAWESVSLGKGMEDQDLWQLTMRCLVVATSTPAAPSARADVVTVDDVVTIDEVRVPEALALREPPPLGPFQAPAAARRLAAAGAARPLAARAVRRNGVPSQIPPTRPTIRAVGGATSGAPPADRFAGLGALPRIELAAGCHRVTASLSSGPDLNDPTGLGSNARAAAKTTFSLSPPDDHLIAEISDRAYELYEHRRATGTPGDATGDWLAAQAAVLPRFIRDRAYFLWQKDGSPVGTEAVPDWLNAELATWLSGLRGENT